MKFSKTKLATITLPLAALALTACAAGHGSPSAAPSSARPTVSQSASAPAAVSPQTSAPAPAPIEPVSTKVCGKVQAAWAPYSQTGANANLTVADELAVGRRVWNLAQRIPGSEVYVGTSQTPGLKVAMDIWGQEAQILGHGGSANSSTIRREAQTIENNCATLGVSNVWGLSS